MSRGLNYAASVSPAFNLLQKMGEGGGLASMLSGSVGGGKTGGPLSLGLEPTQPQPTAFNQPTQKYERSIFGNQWRPTTPEEDRQYQHAWRQDTRNVGGGAGQVDRSLARAADAQDEAAGGK